MRNNVIVTALTAVVFAAVGYATASSTPSTDGILHGCVNKGSGGLRVVAPNQPCRGSENPVSWNQTGPAGPKGDAGETGPAGPASIDALDGSACTQADGSDGTVTVTVGDDDAISMTCGATTTWCATHTPPGDDNFLHQQVTCDEQTRTLMYTCDDGWRDANDDHADGCEASTEPPTAISFDPAEVERLTLLVPDRPKADVDVRADCDAAPPIACTSGVPDTDLVTIHLDSWSRPGDRPRAEAVPNAAEGTFAMTQRVRVSTNKPIPVTLPTVGQCGLVIDSSQGHVPDVTVTYTDTVPAARPEGPTVVSSPPAVTGLETDDVELTGGFACVIAAAPLVPIATDVLATAIAPWIVTGATVCGASEPAYYQRCTP